MIQKKHLRAILFLGLILALRTASHASGQPITNNDYRVDLTQTVTTGSTRKIGMGGAFVGLAEGNAAIPDNPAAAAYRSRQFMRPWEFDMVAGSLVTTNDDADNSGSTGQIYSNNVLVDLGLMAQYKQLGVGGVGQMSVYSSNELLQNKVAQFLSGTLAAGYSFLDNQLALGVSVNPIGARLHDKDSHDPRDFQLRGNGWGTGVIYHPDRGPWRFGAAYTSPVHSTENLAQSSSPIKVGNLIAPGGAVIAQSLALGTAYEWNRFPLWLQRPAIGTFDVKIFGESPGDANGTDAFISQTTLPVGQKTIVTEHAGLEVEAIPNYLRLRAGTYHEPSRYDGVSARNHITGGFELRLTPFNVWDKRPAALSFGIDSASRYLVYSFSIWVYTFTVPVPASGSKKQ